MTTRGHDMPFGARVSDCGVTFALWAPEARTVHVIVDNGTPRPMSSFGDGWHKATVMEAHDGSGYRFCIDGALLIPDPASRFQPDGPFGDSRVVDPHGFLWLDDRWPGRPWNEAVIYEAHVGAFTPEGTYDALAEHLHDLRELGITALEMMPLADCPGARNWGYDGALPFAPNESYGQPSDLKRLIARAHALELMVLLDVVYNHFGPSGNYLHRYAKSFFSDRHSTPWGAGMNFDGAGSHVVRDFFIHNALYWLEEFHFDGLRLDAVHAIADHSKPHILAELAERVRAAIPARQVHLILEKMIIMRRIAIAVGHAFIPPNGTTTSIIAGMSCSLGRRTDITKIGPNVLRGILHVHFQKALSIRARCQVIAQAASAVSHRATSRQQHSLPFCKIMIRSVTVLLVKGSRRSLIRTAFRLRAPFFFYLRKSRCSSWEMNGRLRARSCTSSIL